MTRLLASVWAYRLVRWLIAGVFLTAGVMKAFDPDQFVEAISDFGLLPESVLSVTAVVLITAELVAGIGLLLDVRGSLGLIVALLLLFLGVLSYGMALGLDIDCGCFGPGEADITLQQAWYRDLALLAGCGLVYGSRWWRSTGPLTWPRLWRRICETIGAREKWQP